ncbi:MAG TPA: 2-phosphosulfolactate phosphatase [Gemmatimonadaceae bacterium]|nr:2-phosphosulfolactate phosphatase [Gemmatimonadaceae bacterium]
MRVEVFFTPQQVAPSDVAGRVVVVIDVLRASSTVAAALANGAKAVVPFDSSEEAITRAKQFERGLVKLAGERKMHAIPGFDLGNSPREFTREAVEGKTILLTTTNGTGVFGVVQGARDVVVASYVNFSSASAMLRAAARAGTDISIVCAGREKRFSLEDAACAGRYTRHIVKRLTDVELNDGAHAASMIDRRYGDNLPRLFGEATHGRALAEAGYSEDLELCATVDAFPVIPVYSDRQITKLGPERER